jgi:hypothetical protein
MLGFFVKLALAFYVSWTEAWNLVKPRFVGKIGHHLL